MIWFQIIAQYFVSLPNENEVKMHINLDHEKK